MKAIELTDEHKDKLLEMCDVLFPKYDDIQISKNYYPDILIKLGTLNCPSENIPDLLWLVDNKNDDFEVFHWFEFCLTKLPKKIDDALNLDNNKIFYELGFFRERITTYHDIVREYFETFENVEEENPNIRGYELSTHPVDFMFNFVKYCEKNKFFKSEEFKKLK
jgi:hypothetical protein